MALTLLHSDSFNRSNRDLNGDTMSDGVGVWTTITGSYAVASNQGQPSGGSPAVAVDSAMSAVGDQAAQMVTTAGDQGVICRWTSGVAEGTFYLLYRNGNQPVLYRADDSGSFTAIPGGTGGASDIANGDTIKIEAIGSTITAYVNGVPKASGTDSTYATGKCGEYGGYGGGVAFDDWACYTDAATGQPTRKRMGGMAGNAFGARGVW